MATPDEMLVNEIFMDGCNHPDYMLDSSEHRGWRTHEAVCSRCGVRATLGSEFTRAHPLWTSDAPKREFKDPIVALNSLVRPYFLDLIAAREVLRGIESKGWRWERQVRDHVFTYAAECGARRVLGAESSIEVEAIRNMAVKLARSPHFRLSR
jgi:hypothetical protein